MTRLSDFNIRKIVLILAILTGPVVSLFSQDVKEISGIINVYRKVVAVGSTPPNNVTLTSVDSVATGDTIMLIQMQGVKIQTDNGSYGLLYLDSIGTPGGYEFLLVDHIDVNTKKVFFTRYMQKNYDPKGNVQLIVVPYYDKARVKEKLTSKPWDSTSGTGGVLTLIVGSKLEIDKLNGEIDVSGKGFNGGLSETGLGECVFSDFPAYSRDSYASSWNNAGNKGEGVASHDLFETLLYPFHAKGQGPNFTGGGGGNGKFSGGGGGANRGVGADGKLENNSSTADGCGSNAYTGALGGTTNLAPLYTDGIYLGGGGGASIHAAGAAVSNGGKGGGIVVILADTISGNGRSIKANGTSATDVSGNAGGGGGGAGGSILLSLRSFTADPANSLNISAKGGNGGFRASSWGSGGGGGGGLLSVSNSILPLNVIPDISYGTPAPVSFPQGLGALTFNLIPQVNGFLFNAIRSEVTGNQIDSICSNVPFGKILGTNPVGGQLPYTIRWQKSIVSEASDFIDIPGATDRDYIVGSLSQTTWFRRIVTDNSSPVIIDVSIPVQVIVHQAITGNDVGRDTTICQGQNPLPLVPLNSGPSDGHSPYYNYKWLQYNNNPSVYSSDSIAAGPDIITKAYYDPPALAKSMYYQRYVTSGRCINYSQLVKITVLPSIENNIIFNSDTAVCQPNPFDYLKAKNVTGGNGSYSYAWQESPANSYPWATKADDPTITINKYNPVEDLVNEAVLTRYFRRMIISGPNGVCKDSTTGIKLTQYPKIRNNIIKDELNNTIPSDGSLCQPGSTLILNGTLPQGGNGQGYTYQWFKGTSSNISAMLPISGETGANYEGSDNTDQLHFSRVVTDLSGLCTNSTALTQRVLVYRKPVANAGINADVCGGTVTLRASSLLDDIGQTKYWEFSRNDDTIKYHTDSLKFTATVNIDTAFFQNKGNQLVTFSWKEVNGRGLVGECFDRATVKINFFTRVKELGPDRDTAFYSFSDIIHLDADPYELWETGLWTTINGSDNFDDHAKPDATIDDLIEGKNLYRWTVSNKNSSGTAICTDSYLYEITNIDIYIPNAFSPNGDGLYDTFIVKGLDPENQEAELRIVNSAGTEVFYTTNKGEKEWADWDGRNTKGNDLPEGTYYYLLRLIDNDNNTEVYKKQGFVVLKRFGQLD